MFLWPSTVNLGVPSLVARRSASGYGCGILVVHVYEYQDACTCVYCSSFVHLGYQLVSDVFGHHISKSLHVGRPRRSGVSLSLRCTPSASLAWGALTTDRAHEGIEQATTRCFCFPFFVFLLLLHFL